MTNTAPRTAEVNLTCGHTGPSTLFRLTPRQAYYGYTMGDNVYDMLVTCPVCKSLVGLAKFGA